MADATQTPLLQNPPKFRGSGKDYHQSFAQPDFGAELKEGLSGDFLLIFLCLRPKRAPEKSARNPGYQ